jgi:hypothetical protein
MQIAAAFLGIAFCVAAVTLECYGCTSCDNYPQSNSTCNFANMELSSAGQTVTPVWQVSPRYHFSGILYDTLTFLGWRIFLPRPMPNLPESASATNRSPLITRRISMLSLGRRPSKQTLLRCNEYRICCLYILYYHGSCSIQEC